MERASGIVSKCAPTQRCEPSSTPLLRRRRVRRGYGLQEKPLSVGASAAVTDSWYGRARSRSISTKEGGCGAGAEAQAQPRGRCNGAESAVWRGAGCKILLAALEVRGDGEVVAVQGQGSPPRVVGGVNGDGDGMEGAIDGSTRTRDTRPVGEPALRRSTLATSALPALRTFPPKTYTRCNTSQMAPQP